MRRLRGASEAPLFPELVRDDVLSGERIVERGGDVRCSGAGWPRPKPTRCSRRSARTRRGRRSGVRCTTASSTFRASKPGAATIARRPGAKSCSPCAARLEELLGARFAFVLLNRYRNGSDSVAWQTIARSKAWPIRSSRRFRWARRAPSICVPKTTANACSRSISNTATCRHAGDTPAQLGASRREGARQRRAHKSHVPSAT